MIKRVKSHLISASRRLLRTRLKSYKQCRARIGNGVGLEIGGPTPLFMQPLFPVYNDAVRVDNCNFAFHTVWEGSLKEGDNFHFDKRHEPGRQYITEATDLSAMASEAYDFVLASHVLEHVANTILALHEWKRVLKQHGTMVLVVPHRDGTFDHRRPVTPLTHFIQDYQQHVTEGDLTHLEEILQLHDLSLDPGAGDLASFQERSKHNPTNRCLHHHVYYTRTAIAIVDYIGLQILSVEPFLPDSILIVAEKPTDGEPTHNEAFRDGHPAAWRSPFPSDNAAMG